MNYEAIPQALKAVPQWIVFRLRTNGEKTDKLPVNRRTKRVHDAHDPTIWMTFEQAVAAAPQFDGIGFVFTANDPFTGIDLDKALGLDDLPEPWAEQVLDCFQSYAERSPGRKGIHVIVVGQLPSGCIHKINGQGGNGTGSIEAYDRLRFFTFTGDRLEGSPTEVHDRQEELTAFCQARLTPEPATKGDPVEAAPNALSDEDILSFARTTWPVDRFKALFDEGELTAYEGDWNRADMALCNFLAFWSGGSAVAVDRIFRKSALMRDKWDKKRGNTTYGGYTIAKVLGSSTAFFDPGIETDPTEPTGTRKSKPTELPPLKTADWDPPILDDNVAAEPFPLEVFPPELGEFLRLGASCLTCPVDFLATTALVIAGSAVGRSVALKVKETWIETGSLYAALVARPGATKSPALAMVARPLAKIATDLIRQYKLEIGRIAKEDPRPTLRRVSVSDATCESLGPILAENPRGIALVRDELTAWVTGLDQYKSGGKGSDRQFYLSAWAGATLTVDRKGQHESGPLHIPHPFLSVVGALTPDMISALAESKARDDGFIDRLLFCMPDPVRVRWNTETIPTVLSDGWLMAIQALHAQPMMHGNDGEPAPFFAQFTPDARALYAEWFNAHCIESEGEDFPRHLEGPWTKMRAYCARFALILDRLRRAYYPNDDEGQDVSAASVQGATRLTHYFKSHCRRVRGLIGVDNPDARAILKWIKKSNRPIFSLREARLNFHGRFAHSPQQLESAIRWLISHSCIRPLEIPAKHGGGRPHSGAYEVNPALLAANQTSVLKVS